MVDSLRRLKKELHDAQRALSEAEARCARDFAKQQSTTQELLDTCTKVERAYQEWLAALDVVEDPLFLYDLDFRILRCNRAYQSLAELPIEQIIGQRYFDVFPKTHEPIRFGSRSHKVPGKRESGIVEVGDAIYRSRAFPVKDRQGDHPYIIHSLVDITEQKQAEARLNASHDLLRSIVENVPLRVFWKDRALRYLGGNTAFAQDLGIAAPEGLLGRNDVELKLESLSPCFAERENRVIASGVAEIGYEISRPGQDGHPTWLRCSTVPLRDSAGGVFGVLGLYEDITERRQVIERLKLFRALLDRSSDAIEVIDPATLQFYDVNDTECRTLGYSREEMLSMTVSDIDPSYSPEGFKQLTEQILKAGSARFEGVHQRKDGSTFPVEISAQFVDLDQPYGVTIVRDITERKQAEEKMRLAAGVFTHAREGILITGSDGNIIDVNASFTRITGYSREEVIGRNPRILSSGRQSKGFYEALWQDLLTRGYWYGEIWNRRKNGEVYAEMLTISAIRDAEGRPQNFVALFSDITAIKTHEAQLEHVAHYDALTNLPNRVLLADRLHQGMVQAQRRGASLAVAYLDLDGFKSINDTHGHKVGDQLLMVVAQRMKEALREEDTLARMGGDEFIAILLDLSDVTTSIPMLNRLLTAASLPVQLGPLTLSVTASLGITFYPQPASGDVDADQLLRQADQAMYQAKLAGKNRYHVFDDVLDRTVRDRYENLERLRRALKQGEFVLYYQPKVNMRTGHVVGVEALIRWQHPELGLLAPETFLPTMEEQPLAVEVGEWVIDTALSQVEQWQSQGVRLPVSVNVGARQLLQGDFVSRLQQILAAHPAVEPDHLTLEILETSALADLQRASLVLEGCHQMGVKFSLDDFGTGYSSLTYLKRLPVTEIKVDQSFVYNMLDDPDDLAILDGVMGLSRAFRRGVIAEGVETVAHGTLLLQLGCDLGQGYGIARPMPADKLPEWVATWRPEATWIDTPVIRRIDEPLLFASVEHRAWVSAIAAFLRGEGSTLPPLDCHHCHFGNWLDSDGLKRYGDRPMFQEIVRLHHAVHNLAEEVLRLCLDQGKSAAMARLDELFALRDALLHQMSLLLRDIAP